MTRVFSELGFGKMGFSKMGHNPLYGHEHNTHPAPEKACFR